MANVLARGGEPSLLKAIAIFQHWMPLNQKCPLEDQSEKSCIGRIEYREKKQIIMGKELEFISEQIGMALSFHSETRTRTHIGLYRNERRFRLPHAQGI